jgi:hypothetical protein
MDFFDDLSFSFGMLLRVSLVFCKTLCYLLKNSKQKYLKTAFFQNGGCIQHGVLPYLLLSIDLLEEA